MDVKIGNEGVNWLNNRPSGGLFNDDDELLNRKDKVHFEQVPTNCYRTMYC